MKIRIILLLALLAVLNSYGRKPLPQDVTVTATSSEAAEGLDLTALGELFRTSDTIEEFERSLNDPDMGVNNLDLDYDGYVDFIRVIDEYYGDVHILILQVPLSETEFQDVATVEIERTEDGDYYMQVHGTDVIYGDNYYVEPVRVHVNLWPIIVFMYRPYYRPYRSIYYWEYYPRWWRPYQPVLYSAYRVRTTRYVRNTPFSATRVSRVHGVRKVNYRPRSSVLVKKGTVSTTRTRKVHGEQKTTPNYGATKVGTKKSVNSGGVKIKSRQKGNVTSGKAKSKTVVKKKSDATRSGSVKKVKITPRTKTVKKVSKTPKSRSVTVKKKTKSGKTVTKKATVSTNKKGKKVTAKKSVSVKKK